jgi:hypothetical protein
LLDLSHGFRHVKRAIRNYLEFPLADFALSNRLVWGATVFVTHDLPLSHLSFRVAIPWLGPTEANALDLQASPMRLG